MKVYEGQGPILQEIEKSKAKSETDGSDFKKIMDQMTPAPSGKDGNSLPKSIGPVSGVQIAYGAEAAKDSLSNIQKNQIVNDLQNTLDLIDLYAAKLGDNSDSKESGMTSLIGQLEDRLAGLREITSSHEMPEKLKSVISDLRITISSEIAKYRRGDYS